MTPNHGPLIFEGKAKKIYSSDIADRLLVEFKDDATAFNAKKRMKIEGKGRLNCQISACIFEMLEAQGIPTHYLGIAADRWMVVQRVDVIPLEVVLRNIASGSLCRQTPINPGRELSPALLDFYYKDDNMEDPLLTEARLALLGLVSKTQLLEIEELARSVNNLLSKFLGRLDLLLVDFKLEMGINSDGQLLVADEVSPDTCRIWDKRSEDLNARILDKDRFRKDLGGIVEAYGEIFKRVQGASNKPRTYT